MQGKERGRYWGKGRQRESGRDRAEQSPELPLPQYEVPKAPGAQSGRIALLPELLPLLFLRKWRTLRWFWEGIGSVVLCDQITPLSSPTTQSLLCLSHLITG